MVRPKPEPPRLSLLLAKKAPVAIVIARVRAKLFHVVKWQYVENVVEYGSWFEGSLYPDSSDVSFDGRHMVYFALNPRSGAFSWTGVCEPPFLKAIAFWEHDSTWLGGGFFLDGRTLWLYMPPGAKSINRMRNVPSRNVEKAYNFRFPEDITTEKTPMEHRMARDSWISLPGAGRGHLLERPSPDGKYRLKFIREDLIDTRKTCYQLFLDGNINPDAVLVDKSVTWADWDEDGKLFIARDGIVSRIDLENPSKPIAALDLSGIVVPQTGGKIDEDLVP